VAARSKLSFKSFGADAGIRVYVDELRVEDGVVSTIKINITAFGQKARAQLR
jgi:hypothetical protein